MADRAEAARLAAVRKLGILDSEPEERFDVFTRLATSLFDAPISTLSIVDSDRVWFKSTRGLAPGVRQVPREIAACAHVIATPEEVMVVPDARQDRRLCSSPLVTGPLGVRFYAGAPLLGPGGEAVGSLCVIDTRPREVEPRLVEALRSLATGVSAALRVHELASLAFKDALTGLGNRRMFDDSLDDAIADAEADGGAVGLLLLDLDGFKAVNEVLGHQGGDAVLREVGRRIAAAGAASDIRILASRLGGDEFAIVLAGLDPSNAAARAADAAKAIVTEINGAPIMVEGLRAVTVATGGVATVQPRSPMVADPRGWLERAADSALYHAKKTGRGAVADYQPGVSTGIGSKRTIAADLRAALASGDDLSLALQPVCDARTRAVKSFEALLRWNHPEHGRISPGDFIPVAERSGLAPLLDAWVLDTACRTRAGWPRSAPCISVNVTPATLVVGDFVASVEAALSRHSLAPDCLVLELTERVLLDAPAAVAESVASLRRLGVRIALDGFGAGRASFGSLRALQFDVVKLDMALTLGIDEPGEAGDRARAVLRGAIDTAHVIGARVVAEGVETEAQLRQLVAAGCDCVQGWLLGRPAPAQAWMETERAA